MRAIRRVCRIVALASLLWGATWAYAFPLPLNTNLNNFHMRGTQPGGLTTNLQTSNSCIACHNGTTLGTGQPVQFYDNWTGSLMSQAARDPVFYACLDIAEADAPASGDICIRCHAPKAWLEGRSTPTNGSAITASDRDGINCAFCHRVVDPFNTLGDAPMEDDQILINLGPNAPQQSMDRGLPSQPGNNGNGNYVVDPSDRRRGPFPLAPPGDPPVLPEVDCDNYHNALESPLHQRSELCATCHDVSLPHFKYDISGTSLVFNGSGVQHPTGNKYDMTPIERTYSEWHKSDFAQGMGVNMNGRFGGPGATFVSTCQECHMPDYTGNACIFTDPSRDDLPAHTFSGASTWQLDAIAAQYGPSGTGELNQSRVNSLAANKGRNTTMLQLAADMTATLDDSQTPGVKQLKVRVTNQTGHKLPSGYPEGRRMWITVQFFDCTNYSNPMAQRGAYDTSTADLDTSNTKVYEMVGGMDDALAASLMRPAGPASHFVLTNKVFKDNRIPPRGFTNANFAAIQASPVDYAFADGQYWDDSWFDIPAYAVGAKVVLYYQATSKEYIEFLRDNNPFPGNPNNRGQTAYNLWAANGKSAPVAMVTLGEPSRINIELKGDLDGDRQVTLSDIPGFVEVLLGDNSDLRKVCAADMDGAGGPNGLDISLFVSKILNP